MVILSAATTFRQIQLVLDRLSLIIARFIDLAVTTDREHSKRSDKLNTVMIYTEPSIDDLERRMERVEAGDGGS
jgi:hypothetical protein